MQKYKQKIAMVTLISVLIVILLYLNFTIWDANYIEGDIEDHISQEMLLIGEGHLSDHLSPEIMEKLKTFFSDCLIPAMIRELLVICCIPFKERCYRYHRSKTLVTLSVRLNN